MNKFLAIFKAENILNSLKNIFSRFPVSALISIIATIVFILYIQGDILKNLDFKDETFLKIGFSLIITFFFSVGTYIFGESFNFSRNKKQIFQIFPIAYGILFFYFFNINFYTFENFIFFVINIICSFSFIFFAPYIKKIYCKNLTENEKDQENFYSYFTDILMIFVSSFLVGLTVFILTSIGFGTLNYLFELKLDEKIFGYIWAISAFFISPFFALNSIPDKNTFENGKFNENSFGLILVKYISIPAIFMYFIILYAYTIKVLSNFHSWPKGEISWLVIGFSTFGYFIYLISYMYEEKISSVKNFRKYFPLVVFPQIFMLFYAIFLRINQYGLTINRYLVLAFGIWLLGISIYYIFSKRKYLAYVFFGIFGFLSFLSIGPWSIYNLPETLQTNFLKEELKKANILKENGEIIPLTNDKKEKTSNIEEINSKINYICNYHNCKKLALDLTKNNLELLKPDSNRPKLLFKDLENWEIEQGLKNYLNVNYYRNNYNPEVNEYYIHTESELNFEIKGFDYIREFKNYNTKKIHDLPKINFEEQKLIIFENGEEVDKIDIKNVLKDLVKKGKKFEENRFNENLYKDFLIYELNSEKTKAKLFINNINFYEKKGKFLGSYNGNDSQINGYLLYSKK